MRHTRYDDVKQIIQADIPVLLTGVAGIGKTTMLKMIAEEIGTRFFAMSMTKQTTLGHIIGFVSVTGDYIPTQFRDCFENGGMFLLDEMDAADPNTILCLNTIENGFLAFPDRVVQKHPDFRLCATANPQNEHNRYTGRNKLDLATMDRFFVFDLDHTQDLEEFLTTKEIAEMAIYIREQFKRNGITKDFTMRDAIRLHKLSGILGYEETLNQLLKVDIKLKEELVKYIVENYGPMMEFDTIQTSDDLMKYCEEQKRIFEKEVKKK